MPDLPIVIPDTAAAPKDYTLTGGQELQLKTVRALIDGTGAASAFLPTLQLLDPNGHVMWEGATSSTVAAGGSADVSWFPGIGRSSSAASSSGLGTMLATSHFGTDVTVNAGTTATLTWDEIVVDGSGTFTNGGGSGTTWSIATPGQYQILCCVTPTANWPAAGSGPVVLEILDPDANLVLRAGAIFDTDGSLESPVLVGMVSTSGGSVPARVRVALKNTTASNFTTQGGQTFLTMNRLGDEVDF